LCVDLELTFSTVLAFLFFFPLIDLTPQSMSFSCPLRTAKPNPRVEGAIALLKVTDLSVEEVTSEANKLYTQWPQLPQETKRGILEAIVEKITIGRGEIDLTLSYLRSSEELVKANIA
jgi:hypothetical protein